MPLSLRRLAFVPLLLLLSLASWGQAITIQQSSTSRKIVFLMIDSSDGKTGKTGLTCAVTLSKNGGAFGAPAGTVAEIANGFYALTPTSADTGTLGPLIVHATGTGSDPSDSVYNIVAFNPDDAVRMGLTALPNASPAASGGLPTVGTGAGQVNPDGTGALPVAMGTTLPTSPTSNTVGQSLFYASQKVGRMGTAQAGGNSTITLDSGASAVDNLYKSHYIKISSGTGTGQWATIVGYVGSTKVATITRPGGGTWTTNPDATSVFWIEPLPYAVDGSGNVTSSVSAYASLQDPATIILGATAASYNVNNSIGAKINQIGPALSPPANFALMSIDSSGRLLLQPTQSGVTIPTVTAVSGNVTVGGYASGQDPATLILAATVDGSLTIKQMHALAQSVIAGKFTVVRNTSAHTLVVTYFRADGTTTLAVLTTTYSDSGLTLATGRTVVFSNLP